MQAVSRESLVLDYAEFVEMACHERPGGIYGSEPSSDDVARNAERLVDLQDRPPDPFSIPYAFQEKAIERWQEYLVARHTAFGPWYHYAHCHYCNSLLSTEELKGDGKTVRSIYLQVCPNCGWWNTDQELYSEYDSISEGDIARSIPRRGNLRQFTVSGSDAPIEALRQHLARHPEQLFLISPTKLEHLVSEVFADFMHCEAIHVGGPHDGGIDIILVNSAHCRYVIQVKRRSSPAAVESVSGIREFVGAMILRGALRGIYVTTATRYSAAATATATAAKQRDVVQFLELVDSAKLIEICGLTTAAIEPHWKRNLSDFNELEVHATGGFHTFMAIAMGHPEWHIATT